MKKVNPLLFVLICVQFITCNLWAQNGNIVKDSIKAKSISKTLTGENPIRELLVYLPPSYTKNIAKHYPVIYLLHGIQDSDSTWIKSKEPLKNIASIMDIGIQEGRFGEMIIVMPNENTNWGGSFYINSVVTGNWEDFTSDELVKYIDSNYRTLPYPQHRAIAGHSMGGYGAIVLAMKHPDVFSIVYGFSPALIQFTKDISPATPSFQKAFTTAFNATSTTDLFKGGLYAVSCVTLGQAFSPNPSNKPFFTDFPFKVQDDKIVPAEPAYSNWKKNFASEMLDTYQDNMRSLKAIRFDAGSEDHFLFIPVASKDFSDKLSALNIDHTFELYNGDHRNRLWGKSGRLINNILPYIWVNLTK